MDLERKVLRINVDETAVRFYMPQRAGLVAKRRRGGPSLAQDASRRQQRSCVTHVAAICDNTAVQPSLPQVFIGNEKVLQAAAVKLLQPALQKNVFLLRRKSGWVNKDFLVSYVKLLAACLEPFALEYQPNSAVGRPASALRALGAPSCRPRKLVGSYRPREVDVASTTAGYGRLFPLQAVPSPPLLGTAL